MTYARFTFISILFITIAAFLAQFIIDFNSENLAATCIVFSSSLLIIGYMAWSKGLKDNPLSTFAIFGFCATTQLGALVAQSAAWTPLVKDLRQPLTTFSILAFAQLIALGTHATYRLFSQNNSENQSIARSLLSTLNIYKIPPARVLWVLGGIGFSAFILGYGGEGTFSKVNQGLMFLAWAPFLIPMYVIQQGPTYCDRKINNVFLVFYISLIIVLGLAVNARGIMLSGFITIALYVLLTALRSESKVSQKLVIKLIIGAIALGALSIPLTELATAMIIARKARGTVSAVKMIEDTIYYVQQPGVLKARRESDKASAQNSAYDESYIANPLLARFIETKFHDNALYFVSTFDEKQRDDLAGKSLDLVIAIIPSPILDILKIDVKKDELQFSIGDYIAYLSIGARLGSYKTGSMIAHSYSLFGVLFIFIYPWICLIMFKIMDLLSFREKDGTVFISALGMLGIWKFFQYGLTAESLQHMLSNIFRYFPQNIITYAFLYFLATKFTQLFLRRRASVRMRARQVGTARPIAYDDGPY